MTPELPGCSSLYPNHHPHTQETCQPLHIVPSLGMPGTFPWCLLIGVRRSQYPSWPLIQVPRSAGGWAFRKWGRCVPASQTPSQELGLGHLTKEPLGEEQRTGALSYSHFLPLHRLSDHLITQDLARINPPPSPLRRGPAKTLAWNLSDSHSRHLEPPSFGSSFTPHSGLRLGGTGYPASR